MIVKDFDLDDVFLMSEIMEKMDIEVELEKYMNTKDAINLFDGDEEKTEEQLNIEAESLGKEMFLKLGLDLAMVFAKRMHRAKKEVAKLIMNLTGKTRDEVSKMKLKEIKQFFKDLVEQEGFKDFFSQAEE